MSDVQGRIIDRLQYDQQLLKAQLAALEARMEALEAKQKGENTRD